MYALNIGWLFCDCNIHNNPSNISQNAISHVQWPMSQMCTLQMWQKGVTCDTFSVTCAHLWHGSLTIWQFYTAIHWRVIFTKDNHQHSSYVPCQPGHLSPAENFERLDQSMQVIRCTSWQSMQVMRIFWTSLQPPRCASRQANKLTS